MSGAEIPKRNNLDLYNQLFVLPHALISLEIAANHYSNVEQVLFLATGRYLDMIISPRNEAAPGASLHFKIPSGFHDRIVLLIF